MQVSDDIRKCVLFLYYRGDGGEPRPAGTAFLLGLPIPGDAANARVCTLTAHHVIAGISRASIDGKVLIRFTTKGGGAGWDEVEVDDWHHVDPNVDCAAIAWRPPDETDYRMFLVERSMTELFNAGDVGIGDEVFIVGLFRNHLGRDRNEPIVRVGNIAAIPSDPIRTRDYGEMKAVLVEARSIGGLSGSPVFVHGGYLRLREGQIHIWRRDRPETEGPFALLGLMHGHWDALETEVDTAFGAEKINMGIGIVVPADEIVGKLRSAIASGG